MKLWQKASCVCAAVLAAAVLICSAALLIYARSTIMDMTRDQALARQRDLAASFGSMVGYYIRGVNSQQVEDSLVRYCFARFADQYSVLIRDGETLYSCVSFDPSDYLIPGERIGGVLSAAEDPSERLYEGRIDGRDILLAGSRETVRGVEYLVYEIQDVTPVHESIAAMARTFALVSLGGILAGAGLVTALMRRGARPLAALSSAARRIAGGEYAIRADVRTKDEIGALAEDFNIMAEAVQTRVAALEETAERQRLFIGGVTHEFKTPLTAVLLHAGTLRGANMTDAERDRSLALIEDQCRWLERLVQTLLRLITPETDIALEEVPAAELFRLVRESAEPALARRGVALVTECGDERLRVNPDLMRSLLVNLVDNAGKSYDPGAPSPTVHLTVRANVLEVRDWGRGIPPEALGRIFEPFFMVDKSRSKKAGGSGLGLALVRHIADAHGAALRVNSVPGQGTAVYVRLQENYDPVIDAAPPPGP